jgi:hypothetical protein
LKYKKSIRLFVILAVFAILFGVYFSSKRIEYFYNFQLDTVTRIEVQSGNSGEVMVVEDVDQMRQILDYLDTLSFRRKFSLPMSGWSYKISMYHGEGMLLSMILKGNSECVIDGTKYSIHSGTNADIYELYQSILNTQ